MLFAFEALEYRKVPDDTIIDALEWLIGHYNTIDFGDFDDDPDYNCFFEIKRLLDSLADKVGLSLDRLKCGNDQSGIIREDIIATLLLIAEQSTIYTKKASEVGSRYTSGSEGHHI